MDIMGYHIGGSVIICCAMPILLYLFYLATILDGRRKPKEGKSRLKDAFPEDEEDEEGEEINEEGMWIISEE